jgi:acylphosphatase
MAVKRLALRVHGHVQLVGFRAFAQRHASSLGLTGYVRNRPDGTLEVEAEGEEEQLNSFLALIRRGPRAAVVTGVEVEWRPPTGGKGPFRISY